MLPVLANCNLLRLDTRKHEAHCAILPRQDLQLLTIPLILPLRKLQLRLKPLSNRESHLLSFCRWMVHPHIFH